MREVGSMPEPIVFVSHFRVKEGKLNELQHHSREILEMVEAEKVRTTAQLAYLDATGTKLSFVHVFTDADTMDLHFQGAEDRSRAAYEFMDPAGWEIYGAPSAAALQMMREAAKSASVPLTVETEYLGGFLRTESA
jgi:quinol monooxygenase YgiN